MGQAWLESVPAPLLYTLHGQDEDGGWLRNRLYPRQAKDAIAGGACPRFHHATTALFWRRPFMLTRQSACCILMVFACFHSLARAEVTVLVDFSKDLDLATVESHNAKLSLNNNALRMEVGQANDIAGFILKPPGGRWNLTQFHEVAVDVKNVGKQPVTVSCKAVSPDTAGKQHASIASLELAPGERNAVRVTLTQALPPEFRLKLVGMRGLPMGIATDIDSANVTQLHIDIVKPAEGCRLEISSPLAWFLNEPNQPIDEDQVFPLIDRFGQFIHKDWLGKIHSEEDLASRKQEEAADLAAHPGPDNWNQYGGWKAGPQLKATGFFRTEKYNGKWWLVDPEGRLFWSQGIWGITATGAATPISDREHWFADLPPDEAPYSQFFKQVSRGAHGYYKDKEHKQFNFLGLNLLRKYGEDWEPQFQAIVHQRLRSWGINTVAGLPTSKTSSLRKMPYVVLFGLSKSLSLAGSTGYWRKFPDVFAPAFREEASKAMAGKPGKGDPWCIGYFVENELGWGDESALAIATLKSPADQPAKEAFVGDLRKKYETIERLNAAWGSRHASWDALQQCTTPPDQKLAQADLENFTSRISERFFEITRDVVKEQAPTQLDLGCRFSRSNPLALRAAAKFCDVISFNRYQYTLADLRLPKGVDRPVLIGEFHFGAIDRGGFHASLCPTADQNGRAQAYKTYVESALDNSNVVGVHWFQLTDQAATGRGDSENFQIGFLDICDTPYAELVQAAREVGAELYQRRSASGVEPPAD